MHLALDPRPYAHVLVLYWPILFLRLWALGVWCKETGRNALFEVTRTGRLIIRFVEDDPADFGRWCVLNRDTRHHAGALDDRGGLYGVSPIVVVRGKALERFGCLMRYVWVRIVLRALPAVRDTS